VLFIGLRTMAEGIETKDVLDKLVALGCDTG
jgi:EAL domain-containing protein (putative c-di-GMP-specific phosphodiesterase class I)